MELLYAYITEFRNLNNIGFNFSPKYLFQYNEVENILYYEQTQVNLANFFGENITNITGVIGMNGSGKSNLIELICLLSKTSGTNFISNYLMVFENGGQLFVRTNITDLRLPVAIKFLETEKTVPNLSVIYFSNVTDNKKGYFPEDVIDLSRNSANKRFVKKLVSETQSQVNFMFSKYRELVDLPTPHSLLLSFPIFRHYNSSSLERLKPLHSFYKLFRQLRRSFGMERPNLKLKCSFRFSLLHFIIKHVLDAMESEVAGFPESNRYSQINQILDGDLTDVKGLDRINVALDSIIQAMMLRFSHIIPLSKALVFDLLQFNNLIDELSPEYTVEQNKKVMSFIINLTVSNQNIFKKFSSVFSVPDLMDAEWGGLSSGHEAFLNLFAQLHSAIHRVSQHENVLVCIDEADLYLHPQWQRQFLNMIVNFVPNIIRRNLQVIITTHSPFLVSDLPRENLLLLSTAVNGNAKLIVGDESMKRTFGANIIDLFLGSFFLDKGTISEFSLQKIKKAIEIAKSAQPTSDELAEANFIADRIGDRLIRIKLLEMLQDVKVR